MTTPRKLATGREFARALEAAGIVEDLNTIERIVIDVRAGDLIKLYIQRIGDERLPLIASMLAEQCCDMHGRNCEPSELCCGECTEGHHGGWTDERGMQRYGHPAGESCSNPDLSVKPAVR